MTDAVMNFLPKRLPRHSHGGTPKHKSPTPIGVRLTYVVGGIRALHFLQRAYQLKGISEKIINNATDNYNENNSHENIEGLLIVWH